MNVIEFQTYIDQGTIHLPTYYHEAFTGRARVIIVMETIEHDEDMVEFLLDHPYQVNVRPFTRDEMYERR